MRRWFWRGAMAVAVLAGAYFVLAAILIALPAPRFETVRTVDEARQWLLDEGMRFCDTCLFTESEFALSDGAMLYARRFPASASTTIIALHGVLGQSAYCSYTASVIQQRELAEMVVIDQRGYGNSGGQSGHVRHVGQYERDLTEVVAQVRERSPGNRIVLMGHSMGGGILLRYARLADAPPVDGYILLAPYFGYDAPTMRRDSPSDDPASDKAYRKIHQTRVVGLFMLNAFGITAWNHFPVVVTNLPEEIAPTHFTFTDALSQGPVGEDYIDALQRIEPSMVVIVGRDDEAFHAEEYEPLVCAHSDGAVRIIEGANHNTIVHHPETIEAIAQFLQSAQ